MTFGSVVEYAGKLVDAAGVVVIVAGILLATWRFALAWRRRNLPAQVAYRGYRQSIGRAILLGLEFLVAGDIIRTVAVSPTFASVGVLAIIVLIRTFLSLELEMEIEGRWPWMARPPAAEVATGARPVDERPPAEPG